jgi:hypothetical protein
LVERKLPKLEVAGSTPVRRLQKSPANRRFPRQQGHRWRVESTLVLGSSATVCHNSALHEGLQGPPVDRLIRQNAPLGGVAAAQALPHSQEVELAIVDLGVGICASLSKNPEYQSHHDLAAIRLALVPTVTATPERNSGYGGEPSSSASFAAM